MRLTQVLCKINRYRVFQVRWEEVKRRKAPVARELLHVQKLGLPLVDGRDFLQEKEEELVPIEIDPDVSPAPVNIQVKLDENHPSYRAETCLSLDDTNVLIEGLNHAKALLNTVQIEEGLPKQVEDAVGTRAIPFQDTRVKRSIMYSQVFDATQALLPKIKDPKQPRWNFTRAYGIDAKRKFELTVTQMLQLCNFAAGKASVSNRTQLRDAYCCTLVEKEGCNFQIQNRSDIVVTSKDPISPLASRSAGSTTSLPNLHPLHFSVSIPKQHFYHSESIFPIAKDYAKSHPHTAFFHYDPTEVQNLYGEPVTDSQFLSRTLVKAFAVASSRAQQLYGDNIKQLPEPITLQVVHTDNKKFHFAVLQLNTLDLNESASERNVFWMMPDPINLYSVCAYVKGKPVLEDYNPEVFQRILSYYCNGLA